MRAFRKSPKTPVFKGTVYLKHSPEFLQNQEFTGVWFVFDNVLVLKDSDIIIPTHNVAFLKGTIDGTL